MSKIFRLKDKECFGLFENVSKVCRAQKSALFFEISDNSEKYL